MKIVNGSFLTIIGKGSIKISSLLTLYNVPHFPNLSCNLLSISKLTSYIKYQANFFSSQCEFQDLNLEKMISNARLSGGIYLFENGIKLSRQNPSTCFKSVLITSENKIML